MVEQKKQQKNQLAQLKNKYLVNIYAGISNNESVRAIHKRLYDETINQKKQGLATSDGMLKVALKSASSIKKKVGGSLFVAGYVKTTYGSLVQGITPQEMVGVLVFDLLNKNHIEKDLSQQITKEADKSEGTNKEEAINNTIAQNRSLTNPKIFYLASQHKDSASDHAPYQGKMYIDEGWKSVIPSVEQQKLIEKYLQKNNVKTMQWVTGEPVWFITRPNCRHYFKSLTFNDVITSSVTKLLDEHKMDTAIGDRQYLQTIKHSTSKDWYDDIRNAQLLLDKYRERLKLHQDMYAQVKTPILANAIEKDKMLIAKWEKYINSKKK